VIPNSGEFHGEIFGEVGRVREFGGVRASIPTGDFHPG
jgi:hypothetical protein